MKTRRRHLVLLALASVLAAGCGEEAGIPRGRLTVTTWEVAARPRDSSPPLRFAAVDSTWTAPDVPRAGGLRSSLAGPMSEAPPGWEPVRTMLLAMVSGARLTAVDSLGVAGDADRASRSWLLELPVDPAAAVRGRYPVEYGRTGSGAWVGEGRMMRDLLWVRRSGEIPDTVRIHLEGTLADTVGVVREARTLRAEGTLFVASLGRILDLSVRMGGQVTRVSAEEVARRHRDTAERLRGVVEGPER